MLFSKPSPPGGGITTGKTPFTLSTSSSSCNCESWNSAKSSLPMDTGAIVLGNEVLLGAIPMDDMDLLLRPR